MSSDGLRTCLWASLVALGLVACAGFERGEPSPDAGPGPSSPGTPGGDDGGEAPSFAAEVHPLLLSGCQSCHRSGGAAGDTDFVLGGEAAADHAVAVGFVDTTTPAQSRLLRKGAGAGHGGGAIYPEGSPEHTTLLAWISAGAAP